MPFQKGNKLQRTRKGKPNKRTLAALDSIEKVMSLIESQYLSKDIEELSSKDRVAVWERCNEYIRPKRARVEHTGKDGDDIKVVWEIKK